MLKRPWRSVILISSTQSHPCHKETGFHRGSAFRFAFRLVFRPGFCPAFRAALFGSSETHFIRNNRQRRHIQG
jgi:hypothetical protein